VHQPVHAAQHVGGGHRQREAARPEPHRGPKGGLHVQAGAAAAQQASSAATQRRGTVELFGYGWEGGIAVGPDGKPRLASYPRVRRVIAGSPAEAAGLRVGDQVVNVDGRDGKEPPLFEHARVGTRVVLRIRRGDEEREISFVPRRAAPAAPGGS
jgi:S1-C subfamily serine protease